MITQDIIEKHWYKIKDLCRGYAYRYKIDSNDLFSMVLEKMCKYTFVDTGYPNAFFRWAHVVIRSVCNDNYRKKENRLVFIGLEHTAPGHDGEMLLDTINGIKITLDSSYTLTDRQTLSNIFRFLRRKFKTRDTHIMYMYAHGYKLVEICEELRLSEGLVKSRIFRMREALDELNLTNYGRRVTKNNSYVGLSTES